MVEQMIVLRADVVDGTPAEAGLDAMQGSAATQQVQAQKHESAILPTGTRNRRPPPYCWNTGQVW